ncbi:MAG TPA: M50 family metallopeptidase [Bacillota bacterium]|nr:M50 family metallopeptidase [Bacillota bacterium]
MRIKLNVFFILFLFVSCIIGWLQQSLIMFASVLLHEFGHVLTAKKSGIKVYEVELMPFGGISRMGELSKLGGAAEAVVSAAGPVTSFVLSLTFSFFREYSGVLESACRYNLIICLFNLLPVIPLDGGRIARNLLCFLMGYRQATKILSSAGKIAAFLLLGFNIHMLAAGSKSGALIIAAVFIYIGALKEEKNSSYYYLFTGNNTKNAMIARGRIRKRFIKVQEDNLIRQIVNKFSPVTQCCVEVADAKGRHKRILSEEEIIKGLLQYGYDGKIAQIING